MKAMALALTLVLAPAVHAQQPATAAAAGSIEGAVVKSTTGQPLKRALVTAQWAGELLVGLQGQHSTHTDAAGHFVLRDLPPGTYNMWVNRDGYLGQAYGQDTPNGPGKTLTLASGESKRDLLFRLIPTGAVVGRVYDEDGEPISGVSVQALRTTYFNGSRQLSTVMGAATNDLGEYRLVGLAAEKYYVSATYSNSDPGDDTESGAYAPVYYPGTADPRGATPVEVRAGEETAIDLNLTPTPAVRVRGRIFSSEILKPGVGVNVMLLRPGMWSSPQNPASLDVSQGNFEFRNVSPGSYFIAVQIFNQGRQYYTRQALEVGNADVDGLGLTPGPGIEVRGHLRVEGHTGLKFRDGSNEIDLTGLQVSLQPRDQMPVGVQPAPVNPDGSFVLKDAPGGNYTLTVCCLPQNLYLKGAHLGSDDALTGGVTLDQAEPPGQFDLVIGTGGSHIEGVVMSDHQPVSEATVVLVPDANQRDQTRLYFPAVTDPQGGFSLGSIPPGEYTLFAWKHIEDGAYYDPEFLGTYEKQGTSVRVEEGTKLKVQLELISAARE